MKAAAENVLADWSTGADLTAPLQGLVETAQTFLVGNLLPMIGNVLAGIPELVYTAWCRRFCRSGTQLVTSLAEGFTQGIPEFFCPMPCRSCWQFTEELRANAGVLRGRRPEPHHPAAERPDRRPAGPDRLCARHHHQHLRGHQR